MDKTTGLRSDQTVLLVTAKSTRAYPKRLRRVSFVKSEREDLTPQQTTVLAELMKDMKDG